MTGLTNNNRDEFDKVERTLKDMGHSVFNPAWMLYDDDTEFTRNDMMAVDIAALSRCDAIYVLKGWSYSYGAIAEVQYARSIGLPMYTDDNICDLR